MTTIRGIVGGAVAGIALAASVGTGIAFAHAELLTSDPQPGAVLDTAPAHVTLTFSEPVEISLGAIRVFDGRGTSINVTAARHRDGRDKEVEVDLPALSNGSYVVDWRVVSADSHPVHAAFTFQVGPTSTLASGLLDQIIGSTHTGRVAGVGLDVSRGVMIAAMAVVFGGLLACGLGIAPFGRRQRGVIAAAGGAGLIAGLIALPLEVGYTAGRPLGVITDGAAWRAVLGTHIGGAWVVRAVVLAACAAALLAARAKCDRVWWRVVLATGLTTVAVASAYGGHGAAGRWHYLGVFATAVHVAAMAVWLGGLTLLLISIADVSRDRVARFSSVALGAVVVIVASGAMQSLRQVGSFSALTDTSYGRLLIWKLIAVVAALAVAAVARMAVHARLARTRPGARTAVGDGFDRPRLQRAVTIEVLLALAIVVVTSLLMAANPSQATASAPFSATVTSNDYLADIGVAPARVGSNEMHIYLSSPNSSLEQPDAVIVTIQDPSRDVNPIAIDIAKAGAGHFVNNATSFPYAATWRLVVKARYGFQEQTFTADVKVV
jgi:copper transport protein